MLIDELKDEFEFAVFEFAITFWVSLVNGFQKVRVETSLFPHYILDDTLDNDTLGNAFQRTYRL